MTEVRVHFKDKLIGAVQCPSKAVNVGGSKPQFARSVFGKNPFVAGCQLVGNGAGPVGTVVINDQQMRIGYHGVYLANQTFEVFFLIVRRNDDEGVVAGYLIPVGHTTLLSSCAVRCGLILFIVE